MEKDKSATFLQIHVHPYILRIYIHVNLVLSDTKVRIVGVNHIITYFV